MIVDVRECKELRELEESLLRPAVRRSREHVSALLAQEFREFGSSGREYTKAQILEELETESEHGSTLQEFACEPVGGDAVLVTYRSVRDQADTVAVQALRSSLWIRRDGRWQMLFHQGTRVAS